MHIVELWSDGSCSGNPGPGGWATILKSGEQVRELTGGEKDSTNNRMEIMGILHGLKALSRPCQVHIHTDSKYVMDCLTKWIHGWRKNGWKTKAGKPVANRELLEQLDQELKRHQIQWVKVTGHAGVDLNERCDYLAVQACKRFGGSGNRRT